MICKNNVCNINKNGNTDARPEETSSGNVTDIKQVNVGVLSPTSLLVPVTLHGISTNAVVDSAAQVTVVSKSFYDRVPPGLTLPTTSTAQLRGIGSGSVIASYVPGAELVIDHVSYALDIYVANIPDDILLGIDFLTRYKCIVDFDKCVLEFPSHVVSSSFQNRNGNLIPVYPARLCRQVTIAPYSVQIASADVGDGTLPDCLLQPVSRTDDCWIYSCCFSGEQAPVIAVNPTDRYITLQPQLIGTVMSCEEVIQPQPVLVRKVEFEGELPEHLVDLYQRSSVHLDPEQCLQLRSLLMEYAGVFSTGDLDIGCLQNVEHHIDTGDARPVGERMRRTPLGFAQEEKEHLQLMLDHGIISPSASEWASAPVLVRKKDGRVRYCTDFRRLNAVTTKDKFPLPLIEDCLSTLSGTKYFNTLDMTSAYWQICIAPTDKHKTAFITKYGQFEYNRLHFGLCNSPATFQRAIQHVLRGLLWEDVLAYLDDCVVLGTTFVNTIINLRKVLTRMTGANLKLKPKKCALFQTSILFLGKMVDAEGITLNPANVNAVLEWPTPVDTKSTERFLGFANYHREHIPKYAELAEPLYALTGPKATFTWGNTQQTAFEALKTRMTTAPLLAYPNSEDTFLLDVDASDVAIGAELSQVQRGVERVVSYGSFILTPAQRRYCTTRKELLAIVRFTRQYRQYLLGRTVVVRTDHHSLTWLTRFKQPIGQLARWLEELSQFDLVIIHREGRRHIN
ncbi:MAG: hypothetical protein DRI57_30125, partial [Deltaproteobacteria bacterium]